MGYTYQEARQVWQELRFSIAYTSSDGDLARKLDAFFDVRAPLRKGEARLTSNMGRPPAAAPC